MQKESLPQKEVRRMRKKIHFFEKKEITLTQILASDLMTCFVSCAVKFPHVIISYYHLSPDKFNDEITILSAWKVYLTSRPVQPGISMHRKPENFDTCICSTMSRRDNPWTLGLIEEAVNKSISKPEKLGALWNGRPGVISTLVTQMALLTSLPAICPLKHPVIARLFATEEPWTCQESKHWSNMHISWILIGQTQVRGITIETINYCNSVTHVFFCLKRCNTTCLAGISC